MEQVSSVATESLLIFNLNHLNINILIIKSMINLYNVSNYCKDDLSLIENYEEAVNSLEQWDCHHRLEIDLNLSAQELKERNLYFNRPASELIFLMHNEHTRLHNTGVNNPWYGKHGSFYNKKHSIETRKKLSESHTGEKNPMYGKPSAIKNKHRVYRDDGTYYFA